MDFLILLNLSWICNTSVLSPQINNVFDIDEKAEEPKKCNTLNILILKIDCWL
jgi:hypothetical protein